MGRDDPVVCLDHTIRFQWMIGFINPRVDMRETFWLCHDFQFDSAFSYVKRVRPMFFFFCNIWYINPSQLLFPSSVLTCDLCLIFFGLCTSSNSNHVLFFCCFFQNMLRNKIDHFLFPTFHPSFSLLLPLILSFLSFHSMFILCNFLCCH